jgi:hypothetical protein
VQLEHEEIKWRQCAKINWLSHGDRNSKFFHAYANQRRKVNNISQIKGEDGRLWESQEEIEGAFVDYFESLFTTSGVVDYEGCLGALEGRVTETMNESLTRPFVEEEVRVALFQMAPLKAPSLDRYNAGFFQKHWDIVGPEVCNAVLFSLNNVVIDKALNSTYIALIPKVRNPTSIMDFRRISLCNAMYKIISNVLANCLKIVLPHINSSF